MSNYPDGTWAGDPRAPWNAPDAEPVECWGCGKEAVDEEVGDICEDCGEDFREKEPYTREDYEADMADQAYDERD